MGIGRFGGSKCVVMSEDAARVYPRVPGNWHIDREGFAKRHRRDKEQESTTDHSKCEGRIRRGHSRVRPGRARWAGKAWDEFTFPRK